MFTTNLGSGESKLLFSTSPTSAAYEFLFALISVVISTSEQLLTSSLSQI